MDMREGERGRETKMVPGTDRCPDGCVRPSQEIEVTLH